MTGGQDHPGTSKTLMGEETNAVDLKAICRAVGVEHVREVDPLRSRRDYQRPEGRDGAGSLLRRHHEQAVHALPVEDQGRTLYRNTGEMHRLRAVLRRRLPVDLGERGKERKGQAEIRDRPDHVHRLHHMRAGLPGGRHRLARAVGRPGKELYE